MDPTPASKGLRAGRYELLYKLASGGMGEIYIARQKGEGAFEKRLALKLLLPHLSEDEEFVRMFLDEARIAARMNHPNIVQIYDLGQTDGRYFIAMALIEGVSLSRLLKACRRRQVFLPLQVVNAIAQALCDALSYAHELVGPNGEHHGVVHRDVNPSNLLVSSMGAVLLGDFGIAKAQDNLHRTRPGDVKGKYAYMAPEQMRSGAPADPRADVFSAAITLFEAFTLHSPFLRTTDPETIDAVRSGQIPDPRQFRPELPEAVAAALLKGAAHEPDERFSSARALKEAVIAGPIAPPAEVGRWVRELCSDELAPFQRDAAASAEHPATASIRVSTVDERKRSWRVPVTTVGVLALATAAIAFWGARAPQPVPVQPELSPQLEAADPLQSPPLEFEPVDLGSADEPGTAPSRDVAGSKPARSLRAGKKKTPSPAMTRLGYLSADAAPWAIVLVEGREIDRTPISRYPLPVGEHVLVFKNPQKGEIRRRVRIAEGVETSVRVTFD